MNAVIESIALESPGSEIRKPEITQIEELVTSFAKAWNQHDAASFSSLFETDGDFVDVIGRHAEGRARIACEFLMLQHEIAGGSVLSNPEIAVQFLAPHTAVAVTRWYLDAAASPSQGWATYVLVKRGERWLIRNARMSRRVTSTLAAASGELS